MSEEFIVFARPRVGTHMFKSGINGHTEIHCADELLNIWMLLPQRQACITLTDFRARIHENNQHSKLFGWVLHDDQYHFPTRRCIRVSRTEFDEIPTTTKVIRLDRRNEFARLVSECRARLSNVWQRSQRRVYENDDLPFHMDFNKLMHWYTLHHEAQLSHEKYFKRFPNSMYVWYEDLLTDWDTQMTRVFNFLGVGTVPVQPKTMKMGQPLRYMVSNYDEIEEKCRGTDLERFFDG